MMFEKNNTSSGSRAERRRHPRHIIKMELQFELTVAGRGKKVIPARSTNISLDGLAMLSEHEFFDLDQKIIVHLSIPPKEKRKLKYFPLPTDPHEAETIYLNARVVWCHIFGTSKFITGVLFIDFSENNQRILSEFFEDAKAEDRHLDY